MLLNLSIFMWFGAVCPWSSFVHNDIIPIYRLMFLGVLVLLFRRLPIIYAMHWKITQIERKRHALFVGFFGPIGVSAIFYLYISLDFLGLVKTGDDVPRQDATRLSETMTVVIWFLAICSIVRILLFLSPPRHTPFHEISIFPPNSFGVLTRETTFQVVHGLSIPLGKMGYQLPRTLSQSLRPTDAENGNE